MAIQILKPQFDRDGTVAQVRLSPDGKQLAFTVKGGAHAGLYAGDVGSNRWRKLVGYSNWTTNSYAWSGDGGFIAYRITGDSPGVDDRIGWVSTEKRGKLSWLPGVGFAWSHRTAVLYVLDAGALSLVRHDVLKGTSRRLADFHHHHSATHLPQVVPSPDGSRVVFTARNMLEDATHVFVNSRRGGEIVCDELTWIPGAEVHVFPFWSPKSVSLGLFMVHEALDTTGLVLVKALQGEGEIYYQRDGLDVASTPAWAPDGSAIVFQREGAELATLEIASRQLGSLSNGVQLSGTPRFLPDGRLVLEGGDAAYILPDAAPESV